LYLTNGSVELASSSDSNNMLKFSGIAFITIGTSTRPSATKDKEQI
jgi:hypothetical protein